MDGKCGNQLIAENRELCNLARQLHKIEITFFSFGGHSLAGAETALLLECCCKNWAATSCRLGGRKQGPKCTLEVVLYQCTMTHTVVSCCIQFAKANCSQHLLTRYSLDNLLF